MVERFNRFLRTALRCYDNSEKWFDHLGLALLGINASFNSDIEMSRAERIFGKKLRLPCSYFDESTPRPNRDDPELVKNLMEFFANREPAPINTQPNYKKVQVDQRLFSCDAVYMRVDRVKKGLEPSFTGPYKIIKKSEKYFTIETSKGTQNISLDRLKPAFCVKSLNDNCKTSSKTNQLSFSEKQVLNNSSAESLDNSRTLNPTANTEGDRQSVTLSSEPTPSQPTTTRSG